MKKTLLLTSLIAVATMAATTGSVKGFAETEANFNTTFTPSTSDNKKIEGKTTKDFKAGKIGVETEVKVKDTGFSFGGTFQAKDLVLNKTYSPNYLNNSSVWAKYELPEIKGVNSYIKATVSPKFTKEYKVEKDYVVDRGNAELEADVNTMVKDVKVGLNSKTKFPFSVEKVTKLSDADPKTVKTWGTEEYGKLVESTHKIYAEAKSLSVLEDVKANVSLNHTYNKIDNGAELKEVLKTAIKNVSGEAEVNYNKIKDLKLNGKVNFKANVYDEYGIEVKKNDVELFKTNKDANPSKDIKALYNHEYNVTATYTGVKNLELVANPFVGHIGQSYSVDDSKKVTREDIAYYGVIASAKYTGIKNLTLTGKTQLAGTTDILITADKVTASTTKGYFLFDLNAKYDHKVSDKFTVSPEVSAKLDVRTEEKDIVGGNKKTDAKPVADVPSLTLTPKVSAEYKPADSLTIKGSVELPVSFGKLDGVHYNSTDKKYETSDNSTKNPNVFGYKSTSFKTSLNVKYTW